jgi:hypothetical protein
MKTAEWVATVKIHSKTQTYVLLCMRFGRMDRTHSIVGFRCRYTWPVAIMLLFRPVFPYINLIFNFHSNVYHLDPLHLLSRNKDQLLLIYGTLLFPWDQTKAEFSRCDLFIKSSEYYSIMKLKSTIHLYILPPMFGNNLF